MGETEVEICHPATSGDVSLVLANVKVERQVRKGPDPSSFPSPCQAERNMSQNDTGLSLLMVVQCSESAFEGKGGVRKTCEHGRSRGLLKCLLAARTCALAEYGLTFAIECAVETHGLSSRGQPGMT
ncbi:hypothetical protein KIL84_019376 [Mauremys mutica]|uniref:Uncharacterized protein n=1 Tax=Mauremys mutica TaxID=74926 RepID=A0A9D4B3A3_9SAUR|nr:hypothetical protein KIL84_019376 [Mauremys mutica]